MLSIFYFINFKYKKNNNILIIIIIKFNNNLNNNVISYFINKNTSVKKKLHFKFINILKITYKIYINKLLK